MDKNILYLMVGGWVVGLLLLCGGAILLFQPTSGGTAAPTAVAQAETIAVATATTVSLPTATATAVATLPPPRIEQLPTNTPPPTNTPAPTATPLPTETPAPTNTPVPTAPPVQPTNPPPPPPPPAQPTATPVPPPTAVPANTRGLSATFGIEGGPNFGGNQEIWFNFFVTNSSGGAVPFSVLGVYPKKDGVPRPDLIQASWGGSGNENIPTSGLQWRDNIKIGESGNYTLQLGICFDASYQGCRAGGGTWIFLSGDVPVTIN